MSVISTVVTFISSVILPGTSLVINIIKYAVTAVTALKEMFSLFKKLWSRAKEWSTMSEAMMKT